MIEQLDHVVHQQGSGGGKVEIVVWAEVEAGSRRRSKRESTQGRPLRLLLEPGQDHDVTCAGALLDGACNSAASLTA
jgi:hypothetical protein